MIRLLTTLVLVLASSLISFSSYSIDADSTQESSINFLSMEATLSSKIVHFKWEVEAESKGDYFIIEKSIDQKNWVEVNRIESIENHNDRHTYEISEINFAEGIQEYFRILRVDVYGSISELDRVDINQPVLTNMLLIPMARKVNKELTVSYDSMISSSSHLTVFSQNGDLIVDKNISQSQGYNRLQLNIKGFDKGNYKVTIKDDFGNKISRNLTIHGSKGKTKF